jgi:hypothetical protein
LRIKGGSKNPGPEIGNKKPCPDGKGFSYQDLV